jgi:hypothetical protein
VRRAVSFRPQTENSFPLDPQLFADACAKLGAPATRVLELGERLELRAAASLTTA